MKGLHTSREAIKELLLSLVAPLRNTVKEDMIEAFGNSSATYFSILEGIAMGKNTNNEVAAYVGLKETSLPIDYSTQHNPYSQSQIINEMHTGNFQVKSDKFMDLQDWISAQST